MVNQLLMALLPFHSTIFLFPPSSFQVIDLLVTTLHPSLLLFLAFHGFVIPILTSTGLDFSIQFRLGAPLPQVPHSLAVPFIPPIRLMLRKLDNLSLFILLVHLTIPLASSDWLCPSRFGPHFRTG